MKSKSIESLMEERVERVTETGCHLWTGFHHAFGYGMLRVDGRQVLAHRVSYAAAHGPIPRRLHVLHRCDVPACVNPAHLFLGTQADNMRDMFAKNRRTSAKGERHGQAKLTDEQVRMIRSDPRPGIELARELGVSHTVVYRVRNGRGWTHVH